MVDQRDGLRVLVIRGQAVGPADALSVPNQRRCGLAVRDGPAFEDLLEGHGSAVTETRWTVVPDVARLTLARRSKWQPSAS